MKPRHWRDVESDGLCTVSCCLRVAIAADRAPGLLRSRRDVVAPRRAIGGAVAIETHEERSMRSGTVRVDVCAVRPSVSRQSYRAG
jgi:hypothetical protein